jgi:CheY-like chemotaxis protein
MKKVYLIDDDEVFVFLTKRIIEKSNTNVSIQVFTNGQDAVDHLLDIAADTEALPDVILLDLNMPVMDGWEFLEVYQHIAFAEGARPNLYIVTSSISPHEIERAKHLKIVNEFIVKPLAKEKFIEIISNL